jgi:hypothetical protein
MVLQLSIKVSLLQLKQGYHENQDKADSGIRVFVD